MTETKKWQRRAIKAEEELEQIAKIRRFETTMQMRLIHENAALLTAMKEIQNTTNWAYGAIAEKLEEKK